MVGPVIFSIASRNRQIYAMVSKEKSEENGGTEDKVEEEAYVFGVI